MLYFFLWILYFIFSFSVYSFFPTTNNINNLCDTWRNVVVIDEYLYENTVNAADAWEEYLGCKQFNVYKDVLNDFPTLKSDGVIAISYDPTHVISKPLIAVSYPQRIRNEWDIIVIRNTYQLFGIIAHELGHTLNLSHESDIPIMRIEMWHGPKTCWKNITNYC